MIIDTHGHYDDEQFDVDREMLLTNLKERGLKAIVTVGASLQTSENASGGNVSRSEGGCCR